MTHQWRDSAKSSEPFHRWYEIRNAPKPDGDVIAIWHKTKSEFELAFGVKDVTYSNTDPNDMRTFSTNDVGVIAGTLMHRITGPDFDVLTEIADIPQIISDGVLHHLGILRWHHREQSVIALTETSCIGTVYTKVVLPPFMGSGIPSTY